MWAKHFKERTGGDVFMKEDIGFIAYKILGEECFIYEAFVEEKHRNKGEARSLLSAVENCAKSYGCKYLTASVATDALNATESLLASLHCGFKLHGSAPGMIGLKKEL